MINSVISGILPIFILILGPVLASYIAAQVMRENGLTGATGKRSVCDHCGYTLTAHDLIPLLSFVINRGRCRKCAQRIDIRIWLVELMGLLFFGVLAWGVYTLAGINPDATWQNLVYALFGSVVLAMLLALSIHDVFTFSIPLRFTQIAAGVVILANILVIVVRLINTSALPDLQLGFGHNLVAGVGYALFFQLVIWLTKQKGMGSGDVFIGLIIGMALGWPSTVTAFYVMIFSASVVGIVYAFTRHSYRGTIVPLVPFLSFGFVVAYVWGYNVFSFLFFQP